jgi:hypothetical protein
MRQINIFNLAGVFDEILELLIVDVHGVSSSGLHWQ